MTWALRIFGTSLLFAGLVISTHLFLQSQKVPKAEIQRVSPRETFGLAPPQPERPDIVPEQRKDSFYAEVMARPLFAPTRRPNTPKPQAKELVPESQPQLSEPVKASPPKAIPEPKVVLLGVLTGGARNSALVSLDGSPPEWRRQGSKIAGWTLVQVEAKEIELREGDRALKIELYRK